MVDAFFQLSLADNVWLENLGVLAGGGLLLDWTIRRVSAVCFFLKGCDDVLVVGSVAVLAAASVVGLRPASFELGVDIAGSLGTALTLRRPTSGICVAKYVCR